MVTAGLGNAQSINLPLQVAPVTVKNVVLQPSYSYSQRVLARVEALQSSAVGFDLSGLVTHVYVDEGSVVKKGDILARLDIERLEASKNEIKSSLARAKAEQRLAELSKNRLSKVVAKGLEPEQVLDEAMVNLDVAKASVAQINAQLLSLNVDIEKSNLVAAFDGTIIQRHLDPGVSVTAGQAVVSIQSDGQLELRASLPINLVNWLQRGDLVDFADNSQSAVLDRFITSQNTQTRTQDAFFRVNSSSWEGRSGQIVNLVVPVSQSANGVWIPVSALSGGIRGMWTVYVTEGDNELNVVPRIVEVVYSDEQRAFVSGALQNGDKLIIEGTQRIVPGQRVRIMEVE
nr:efflux RND transporter periplasmic adaptor subunit [Alteromonas sp. 5E99-2]